MRAHYDLIVIGLGHAGAECAHAAARMGLHVLGIDPNRGAVKMSCNPAMGGVAKGQILREIDALGGLSGRMADSSAIQFRMLNRSKGPAMWSPRTQNDRALFAQHWQQALEQTPRLDFWQDMVTALLVEKGRAAGVKTAMGLQLRSRAVALCSGTFLEGIIHIGNQRFGGGRRGQRPSQGLSAQLQQLGLHAGRMNTGTPPRVDGRTLDYSCMEAQPGDTPPGKFSFAPTPALQQQRSCHITYTNAQVHQLIAAGFDKTPNLNGNLGGSGPQYCPSIEGKIQRFASKPRHQIFVEPEGWHTVEVYVNGFATALPQQLQLQALRAIPGFGKANMFYPGYSIEYDYFPPTQLWPTLQSRPLPGLYLAGQPNGTTGYEEAAAQGLMAGINAARKLQGQDPVVLGRAQAYIGVLLDDLVHKGVAGDPYRMFTSRAEHRILLRHDNADLRLTPLGHQLGLICAQRYTAFQHKQDSITTLRQAISSWKLTPQQAAPLLQRLDSAPISESKPLAQLLKRPGLTLRALLDCAPELAQQAKSHSSEALAQVEIQVKYEDYLEKEQQLVEKTKRLEALALPQTLDYHSLKGLSTEAREKLSRMRPATLAQASRISGVSPADITVLIVHLGR